MARGVKVHDPNDPKVGVVGGGAYAPAPHAPSPAAGHPYNPYCPVSWLPALGRLEHLLTLWLITFSNCRKRVVQKVLDQFVSENCLN